MLLRTAQYLYHAVSRANNKTLEIRLDNQHGSELDTIRRREGGAATPPRLINKSQAKITTSLAISISQSFYKEHCSSCTHLELLLRPGRCVSQFYSTYGAAVQCFFSMRFPLDTYHHACFLSSFLRLYADPGCPKSVQGKISGLLNELEEWSKAALPGGCQAAQ